MPGAAGAVLPAISPAFFPAFWVGLSIAAPVGPIGLLVIQRTLRHGRVVGLATGLGAAVADAAYGAVGAFGVTALIATLQALRVPLALLGGGFLLLLAWRTWRSSAQALATSCPYCLAYSFAMSSLGSIVVLSCYYPYPFQRLHHSGTRHW